MIGITAICTCYGREEDGYQAEEDVAATATHDDSYPSLDCLGLEVEYACESN